MTCSLMGEFWRMHKIYLARVYDEVCYAARVSRSGAPPDF